MVFDAAFLAGTAASLMMNGACCYYQANREDELRDDLRQEIRREWHLQRKREARQRGEQKELHPSDFEDPYPELMQRSSEEHMSYADKHNVRSASRGSVFSIDSGTIDTGATPYPGRDQLQQDPPSVNALLISRSSSILEDDDDGSDDEEEDNNTDLMYVTATGSDVISLEDVSIASG